MFDAEGLHLRKTSRIRKQAKRRVSRQSATLSGQLSRLEKLNNYTGKKSGLRKVKLKIKV